MPGSFTLTPDDSVRDENVNEDELGRAIPEEWIAQLDAHLHLLGTEVATRMRTQIEALPPDEQSAVELAYADMPKARQRPLIPISDLHRKPETP